MGTGGPSLQSTLTYFLLKKKVSKENFNLTVFLKESHIDLDDGDPWESRTPVYGVRGRRLDHLTNGPLVRLHGFEPGTH